MQYIVHALREHPELAIFLTLAIGFVLGRITIGSFVLGNVVGTLLAGLLVGQLAIEVEPILKVVFFDLFLFATGYKVGPQFIRGLGKNALPQVLLTLVFCVASLMATYVTAKLLGYDAGTAAGLLAGAYTNSATIGTASDAVGRLGLARTVATQLTNNIAVAYAVTYVLGTTSAVWFLSVLAPRILGVDLKDASQRLEAELGGAARKEQPTGYREWDLRAYRLADRWIGRSVAQLEQAFTPDRVFVERIRRNGHVIDAQPESVLAGGDTITLTARHRIVAHGISMGTEVEDRELLSYPVATMDVVLTNRQLVDRTVEELAEEHGRGVALVKLIRGGEEIPFRASTIVNRGDLFRLTGRLEDVERAGKALGYVERPSSETDVVFVGLGIFIGGLIGLASIQVGDFPLTLTTSGGSLILGLIFGWLRSVRPTFGRIPEAALWVFDTLGLAVFIAVVGITAGPDFIAGLRRTGVTLFVVAGVLTVLAHALAVLFGRFVLRMNPIILLGACSGAGTCTPALRALQDAAQSKTPVLGYTIPYAIGAIILAAWGPVIVMMTR